MEGISTQRMFVLALALTDLTFSCVIAGESYCLREPVRIVIPKNFGETVMKAASEAYMTVLIGKMVWAAWNIITALRWNLERLGRSVMVSSIVTSIIVGFTYISTFSASFQSGEGIDVYMLNFYASCLAVEFVFPVLMLLFPVV